MPLWKACFHDIRLQTLVAWCSMLFQIRYMPHQEHHPEIVLSHTYGPVHPNPDIGHWEGGWKELGIGEGRQHHLHQDRCRVEDTYWYSSVHILCLPENVVQNRDLWEVDEAHTQRLLNDGLLIWMLFELAKLPWGQCSCLWQRTHSLCLQQQDLCINRLVVYQKMVYTYRFHDWCTLQQGKHALSLPSATWTAWHTLTIYRSPSFP